ncbi:MAG: LCP family protein [Butyricicoccus sp.]
MKKRKIFAIVIAIYLLIMAAGVGGVYLYVQHQLNKMGSLDTEGLTGQDRADEEIELVEEKESSEDISNILLIGEDSRNPDEDGRSDTMLILSINQKTNTLSLISLMRDMYVSIPGYEDNRINAAYALGGAALLDKTIEKNFGITIDANVAVDFSGFQQAIDTIGGIDLVLTNEEIEYINQGVSTPISSNGSAQQYVHLNGEQVLAFSRIRYIPTKNGTKNDYGRTERQREVIQTAFQSVKGKKWTTLLKLADELLPLVSTDMKNKQVLKYGYTVWKMGVQNMQTYRIPGDDECENQTIRGMQVLVPDLDACKKNLQEWIYGENNED